MSSSPLFNSPNRSANVKRKIPDSFYRPPVLKTQLFSAYDTHQRVIHHSHTNSLPVEAPTPLKSNPNLVSSGSISNIYEKSNTKVHPLAQHTSTTKPLLNDQVKSPYSPIINKLQDTQYFHSKTYSLPVSFDPNPILTTQQTFVPPVRNYNPNGDIPLPPGWDFEKTSNGQIYYINHLTKTTTWEDPRKMFNLPTNQSEINTDLRSNITRTIPLPSGWEEARAANGEVYYINHVNKTTSWEDPRISIYMQQEQPKYYGNPQQFNMKLNFNSSYTPSNQGISNQFSQSSSSLGSSALSISSSSSNSTTSLSSSNPNICRQANQAQLSVNSPKRLQIQLSNSKEQNISNLKRSLEEIAQQKASICKQLEDLSKDEVSLKTKLSPKDLDDVLKMLTVNDNKMGSFSSYDRNEPKNSVQLNQKENLNNDLGSSLLDNSNSSDTDSGDMDSTFLADGPVGASNTSPS